MGSSTRRSVSISRKSPSINVFAGSNISRPCTLTHAPSDIIIEVDGVQFALHKIALASRSGWIRKQVLGSRGSEPLRLILTSLPGGADAFALAAKFCYGITFEINVTNVAMLRCAAEYLEMTEEYGPDNLVACTEMFMEQTVFQNVKKIVQVLCSCQDVISVADNLNIVSRCIKALAFLICVNYERCNGSFQSVKKVQNVVVEWWIDDLLCLPIDLFEKTLLALKSRGLDKASIAGALMHYALQHLEPISNTSMDKFSEVLDQGNSSLLDEHQQRIILEKIVSLLPEEKWTIPVSFLFNLLRVSLLLDSTVACRMELERRIGAQLGDATLEELLIPLSPFVKDTVFDVDFVYRLLVHFVLQSDDEIFSSSHHLPCGSDRPSSPSPDESTRKVAHLIDAYLAEVAADVNLKPSTFINISELLPRCSRDTDDAIYRAIDIYLKAHPTLSDAEKKKICSLMDCQKLSQEACAHAAQNERLPVHIMVQVLYLEQIRLHNTLSCSFADAENLQPYYTSQRLGSSSVSRCISPRESYTSLRQENEDLRHEVTRMRARLNDLENHRAEHQCANDRSSSTHKFLSSVAKTFLKINPFSKKGELKEDTQIKSSRSWRNSTS